MLRTVGIDAKCINRFVAIPEGTQFTLGADITLKGVYQLLAPLLPPYIRWQMTNYVLNPLKSSAEGSQGQDERKAV